jgi:hypothetical protein
VFAASISLRTEVLALILFRLDVDDERQYIVGCS